MMMHKNTGLSLRWDQATFLLLLVPLLVSCAGPSSPFGAIQTLLPQPKVDKVAYDAPTYTELPGMTIERQPQSVAMALTIPEPSPTPKTKTPEPASEKTVEKPNPKKIIVAKRNSSPIRFEPDRQVLHTLSPWSVIISGVREKSPEKYVRVYYNGFDVTKNLISKAQITKNQKDVRFDFRPTRLPFDRKNTIQVTYAPPKQKKLQAYYLPPTCSMYDTHAVANTGKFEVPATYMDAIERTAKEYALNPSMMTGIIAQESAFDPKAVSWAKAIGLTQVTSVAEYEVVDDLEHFPRFPGLNDLSVLQIKNLIARGKANSRNEWRLNPTQSIEGGMAYLRRVDDYWRLNQNSDELAKLRGNPYIVYSQIVLASYNSGPNRVRRAINRLNNSWIQDRELHEAHKYVNRIFSFCYHFSQEVPDEIDPDAASLSLSSKQGGGI